MRTEAQAEADRVRISADAKAQAAALDAQAMIAMADAIQRQGEAEAEAKKKQVEAENALATKFLLRDVALRALDVLPDVTRELMTPAKAISEIKVLQLQGMPSHAAPGGEGNGEAASGFGAASPVLKAILEAGAAYPLLREMLQFSQVDTDKLADKARALLTTLPAEIKSIITNDPALSAKVAELGNRAATQPFEPQSDGPPAQRPAE